MKSIPESLKTWFKIHFAVDFIFGLPLILFPNYIANLFGFNMTETIFARIVGAALIGIGGISLIANNKSIEVFDTLLNLKIMWSISAIVGIFLAIITGAPSSAILFLIIFAVFSGIWMYYKIQLSK